MQDPHHHHPIPPPQPRRIGRVLAVVLVGVAIGILLGIWLVTRPPPALVIHVVVGHTAELRNWALVMDEKRDRDRRSRV